MLRGIDGTSVAGPRYEAQNLTSIRLGFPFWKDFTGIASACRKCASLRFPVGDPRSRAQTKADESLFATILYNSSLIVSRGGMYVPINGHVGILDGSPRCRGRDDRRTRQTLLGVRPVREGRGRGAHPNANDQNGYYHYVSTVLSGLGFPFGRTSLGLHPPAESAQASAFRSVTRGRQIRI
jgi:hypothetical protein